MSTDIRDTNCWSDKYQLPLCPNHFNPHIYMAYINLIDPLSLNKVDYQNYFCSCCGFGVFYRFPNHNQGPGSWDEIIGAASILPEAAIWFLKYFQFKWHRFIFMKGYLKACAYGPGAMSWWDRFLVGSWIRLAVKGNLEPGDAGGRLKNWLIISKTGVLKDYWARKMTTHGYTLKNSFEIEPSDNPWLAENAKQEWF